MDSISDRLQSGITTAVITIIITESLDKGESVWYDEIKNAGDLAK